MLIGGFQPFTLSDFPGRTAAIVFTQGCNMSCPWCHNFYLIPYEFNKYSSILEEKPLFSFLEQRKGLLKGVVITGGEPTIQADLPEFCERVKSLNFAVKLDTNGTNPAMLNKLLKHDLVDFIAMDVKTDLNQYPQLFREKIDPNVILESINIIMSACKAYEFRTTCVRPFVTIKNIDKMAMLVKGAQDYYLQKCKQPKKRHANGNYSTVNENKIMDIINKIKSYVLKCEIR